MHFQAPQDKLPEAFEALRKTFVSELENPGYRLSVANRLWGQEGYHFLPDFLAITRDSYHAELALVDFFHNTEQAREIINQWVEAQTQEKIKDLLPSRHAHPCNPAGADQRDLLQGGLDPPVSQGGDPGRGFPRHGRQDHPRTSHAH